MLNNSIIILGGGPGLGFYIPGMIIHRQLEAKKIPSKIYAYENLISESKRENFVSAKVSFHKNFKFALIAQKLAHDVTDHLDPIIVNDLFNEWDKIQQKRFVVFSGFWTAILDKYIKITNSNDIQVDLCHVDSAASSSWKLVKTDAPNYKHVWFFNWEDTKISYFIKINDNEPLPFQKRNHRFLVHGGGWGIGKYKEIIPVLEKHGCELDILNYEYSDLNKNGSINNRYFMIDPNWHHWLKDEGGNLQFPPFAEIKKDQKPTFKKEQDYPEIYNIIQNNMAIISKPGAGTLLDSLSSATPLVILDPFGDYENKNGLLWEKFNLGIPFDKWAKTNYSSKILEELHNNLINLRKQTKNYLEELLCNPKP